MTNSSPRKTYSVGLQLFGTNEERAARAASLVNFIETELKDEASVLRVSTKLAYLSVSATEAAIKEIEKRPEVTRIEDSPNPIHFEEAKVRFLVAFKNPDGWTSPAETNEDVQKNRGLIKNGAYTEMNKALRDYIEQNGLSENIKPWDHEYYNSFVVLECSEETMKKVAQCLVVHSYTRDREVHALGARPSTPRPQMP